MENLNLSQIDIQAGKVIEPFFADIINHCKEDIVSMYVTGSAVTKDFHPKSSDINTLIIVKTIKISFFDFIALMGKRYGKKGVCAPFIMTPDYINRSLEVFPLEFLEMKLIHQLVYGEDILSAINIEKADARLQCERELKGKLQTLCHGYIKTLGDRKTLAALLTGSLSGFFPVFRGILFLYGKEIPKEKCNVLTALERCCNRNILVFKRLLEIRNTGTSPTLEELKELFRGLYLELDTLAREVDEFEAKLP
ncbi:MAG: hypothetical protein AABY74_08260 [Planctomycetota bacterium]